MIPFTKSTTLHLDCRDLYRRGLQHIEAADAILKLRAASSASLDSLRINRSDKGWDVHIDLTAPVDLANLAYLIDKALEAALELEAPPAPPKEQEDLFPKVRDIIVEQLGVRFEDVQPTSRFIEDLGADSLDLVELVMAYEAEFDIDIEDEAADKILTVQDAVRTIQERQE